MGQVDSRNSLPESSAAFSSQTSRLTGHFADESINLAGKTRLPSGESLNLAGKTYLAPGESLRFTGKSHIPPGNKRVESLLTTSGGGGEGGRGGDFSGGFSSGEFLPGGHSTRAQIKAKSASLPANTGLSVHPPSPTRQRYSSRTRIRLTNMG